MRAISFAALVAVATPLIAYSGSDNSDAASSDHKLYFDVMDNYVFYELRCRGVSVEAAEKFVKKRYGARLAETKRKMEAKYDAATLDGEDRIAMGPPCKKVRGRIKKLDRDLRALEQRLEIN